MAMPMCGVLISCVSLGGFGSAAFMQHGARLAPWSPGEAAGANPAERYYPSVLNLVRPVRVVDRIYIRTGGS